MPPALRAPLSLSASSSTLSLPLPVAEMALFTMMELAACNLKRTSVEAVDVMAALTMMSPS